MLRSVPSGRYVEVAESLACFALIGVQGGDTFSHCCHFAYIFRRINSLSTQHSEHPDRLASTVTVAGIVAPVPRHTKVYTLINTIYCLCTLWCTSFFFLALFGLTVVCTVPTASRLYLHRLSEPWLRGAFSDLLARDVPEPCAKDDLRSLQL